MTMMAPQEQYEKYYNKATGNDVFQGEVDFGPYMKDLHQKLKSNWNPPNDSKNKKVIILFKINKKGELVSCEVYKSSGSTKLDQSAIDAVNKTAPFEPLPTNYEDEDIDIQFMFDYNALKKN